MKSSILINKKDKFFVEDVCIDSIIEKWHESDAKAVADTYMDAVTCAWPVFGSTDLHRLLRIRGLTSCAWVAVADKLPIDDHCIMPPFVQDVDVDDGKVIRFLHADTIEAMAQVLIAIKLPHLVQAGELRESIPTPGKSHVNEHKNTCTYSQISLI